MAIARWDPFKELTRMQEEVNGLFFDRLARRRGALPPEELTGGFVPPVDIFEDKEQVVVTAEMPGVEPKDVDLRVENGTLTLRGERKLEREDQQEQYLRIERSYGTFSRMFSLPTTVDAERIKAEFKNGLLKITLPKREESKPKSIHVEIG